MTERKIATYGLILVAVLSIVGLAATFVIDKSPDAGVVDTFKLVAVACVTGIAALVQGKGSDG